MKFKHLVLTTAAAAALAACSQDKVLEENTGNAIGFRGVLDKATRAQEKNTNNLDNFYVSAFANNEKYFLDLQFQKRATETVFSSTPSYNWPKIPLQFFAYWPDKTQLGNDFNWDQKKFLNFKPNFNVDQQVDFVYATKNSLADQTGSLELRFEHQLSQIEIKAKNTNSAYLYKVQGVRIARVVGKAKSFDMTNKHWDLDVNDKADYSIEYPNHEKELGSSAISLMNSGNAMLLPQITKQWNTGESKNSSKGAYLAVKIQIKTQSNLQVFPPLPDQYRWTAVPINIDWKPGKKYTYILDFSNGASKVDPSEPDTNHPGTDILGGPITFTVQVTPWLSSEDIPMNMSN